MSKSLIVHRAWYFFAGAVVICLAVVVHGRVNSMRISAATVGCFSDDNYVAARFICEEMDKRPQASPLAVVTRKNVEAYLDSKGCDTKAGKFVRCRVYLSEEQVLLVAADRRASLWPRRPRVPAAVVERRNGKAVVRLIQGGVPASLLENSL